MRKRIRQAALMQGIAPVRAWTVLFDADSPSPVGVRADLARGMVAEVAVGDERVRNDFNGVPIFERPIFNATWDDSTRRWVDLVKKGEAGFTLTPTETDRDVVYRSNPFWYQLDLTDTGRITRVSVSDEPLEGYTLAPMFRDGNTPRYRPSFEAAFDSTAHKMHSRANLTPYLGEPSAVHNVVKARSANARFESAAEWFSDYLLLLVEFATFNLQGVMHGVCGKSYKLFNAAAGNSAYPKGLYCSEEPDFAVGDEMALRAGFFENELNLRGNYKISGIVAVDGVGYRLDFSGLDVNELMRGSSFWECSHAIAKTGAALSAVSNATSGRANASLVSPIVWRGKENPWGNVPTLLENMVFKLSRRGELQPYRAKGEGFCVFDDNHYVPDGDLRMAFTAQESFIKGVAITDTGDFLYPVAFDDVAPDKYFATRITMIYGDKEDGVWFALIVGGGYDNATATNHATMELLDKYGGSAKWFNLGGRIIFEEG